MSTFLVSVGVVAVATVLVVRIALSDQDQPATIRRGTRRARRSAPPAVPGPGAAPAARVEPRTALGPAAGAPGRIGPAGGSPPARPGRLGSLGRRLRSGLALVVLVAFVGVLLAVTVGATLALAARALRHAVG